MLIHLIIALNIMLVIVILTGSRLRWLLWYLVEHGFLDFAEFQGVFELLDLAGVNTFDL